MRTKLKREYECKVFEKGQLKLSVLKLIEFLDIQKSEFAMKSQYKDGEFEITKDAMIDELEDICDIGTLDILALHFGKHSIMLSTSLILKELFITYMVFEDVEYTKKLVSLTESTLELKRISDRVIKELPKYSDVFNEEEFDARQTKLKLEQSFNPSNVLAIVWIEISNRLETLLPYQSFDTWIKPVIPSTEGDKLILNCPSEFAKDWIESRYLDLILELIKSVKPSLEEVELRVVKKNDEAV